MNYIDDYLKDNVKTNDIGEACFNGDQLWTTPKGKISSSLKGAIIS